MSNLVRLYEKMGDPEKAEIYQKRVDEHRMQNPYFRFSLAREAFFDRDYETAIKHLKVAIREHKNDDEFYFLLGSVLSHERGREGGAQVDGQGRRGCGHRRGAEQILDQDRDLEGGLGEGGLSVRFSRVENREVELGHTDPFRSGESVLHVPAMVLRRTAKLHPRPMSKNCIRRETAPSGPRYTAPETTAPRGPVGA